MQSFKKIIFVAIGICSPIHVFAQDVFNTVTTPNEQINLDATLQQTSSLTFQQVVYQYVLRIGNYTVTFLIALTVLVFLWGLMVYMFKGAGSDQARVEGRKLMLGGIIGLFVMISVWSLVGILSSTIGHNSKALPQFKTSATQSTNPSNLVPANTTTPQSNTTTQTPAQKRQARWDAFKARTAANYEAAKERLQNLFNRK